MVSMRSQTPCCWCSAGSRGPLPFKGVLIFTLRFQYMQLHTRQERRMTGIWKKGSTSFTVWLFFPPPTVHAGDWNSIGFSVGFSNPVLKLYFHPLTHLLKNRSILNNQFPQLRFSQNVFKEHRRLQHLQTARHDSRATFETEGWGLVVSML